MKNKNKNNKRNTRDRGLTARDDIPLRPIHTYTTRSTTLPKVSDSTVIRTVGHASIAAQATANTASSYNFALSSTGIGSAGSWDQYKLLAVRVTISPDQNAVGLFTNSTTSYVPLYCVIDYDDSSNLSSVAGAEAYSNCIVLNAGESCERLFKPRMAVAAYSGAFTSFANVADQWIDAAYPSVQHYGLKVFIPGATAAQTLLPSWQVTTEYFFAFRKYI